MLLLIHPPLSNPTTFMVYHIHGVGCVIWEIVIQLFEVNLVLANKGIVTI
jgi:hypothetical protein